ncbi:MAG: hypothetical protein H0U16_07125 [Actinobacteria bacterium]|nr:hypothetical protein [Actinomycetota bacterium]
MTALKAVVGAIAAFTALLAAREVALDPYFEALLAAIAAGLTVYAAPNRA